MSKLLQSLSAGVNFLEGVITRIEKAFVYVGMVALFIMMALITANAIMRYLFASSFPGVIETTELYLMPMVVFLVAASLQEDDGNISVTLFQKKLPETLQILINLLAKFVALVIFGIISYMGIMYGWQGYQEGWITVGVIAFPEYWSWIIMGIGFGLFCFRVVLQIRDDIVELIP